MTEFGRRNASLTNQVRSGFRRGQTPKQLDSAAAVATAVMTAMVAAPKLEPLPLWSHRHSSSTGRTTSSPDCPPAAKEEEEEEQDGSGGDILVVLVAAVPRHGHPRCRSSSTFRVPFSP